LNGIIKALFIGFDKKVSIPENRQACVLKTEINRVTSVNVGFENRATC